MQHPRPLNIVFAAHYHEPVKTLVLPLVDYLRRQGMLAQGWAINLKPDAQVSEMAAKAGLDVYVLEQGKKRPKTQPPSAPEASQSPAAPPSVAPASAAHRKTKKDASLLGSALSTWRAARRRSLRARRYFRQWQPDIIILPDDRTQFTTAVIRAAERLGIPSLAIQWAQVADEPLQRRMWAERTRIPEPPKPPRWVERLVHRWLPQDGRLIDGRLRWFYGSPGRALGLRLAQQLPRHNAWSYGGGNATRVGLWGPAWVAAAVRDGIPAARLAATGYPDQDRWHSMAQGLSAARRQEVRRHLGLPLDRPVVTIIGAGLELQKAGRRGSGNVTVGSLTQLFADIAQVCRSLPTVYTVFKVHPRDYGEDFSFLGLEGSGDGTVLRACDTTELCAASDVMVSQWSSLGMIAVALDVPLVIVDPEDMSIVRWWTDRGVAAAVRDPAAAREAIARILERGGSDAARLEACARFRHDHLSLDGRANQRLAAEIARLVDQRG